MIKHSTFLLLVSLCLPGLVIAEAEFDIDADFIVDANVYDGDLFAERISEDSGSELFLRRAKIELGLELDFNAGLEFSAEYNDLNEEVNVDDAYVYFDALNRLQVKLGKFKEPAGLERRHSLTQQYLMERSIATNLFSYGRETGLGLAYDGKAWVLEAAHFLIESDEAAFDDGRASVLHLNVNSWRDDDKTSYLHFGVTFSLRDNPALRYDIDEPLIAHGVGNLFHSPNYFAADEVETQAFEIMGALKEFGLQSEFFTQTVKTRNGDSFEHGGYYLSGVWTLFGDLREYRKGKIRFPRKMKKTLELAARYSHADTANIGEGDIADVWSLALNYYPNNDFRFSFEFEQADLKEYDDGFSRDMDGSSINARFQYLY